MYQKQIDGRSGIMFQPTDVVGIYFHKKNPIPFDKEDCTGSEKGLYLRDPNRMKVGASHAFRTIAPDNWLPCREYAIQVTVEIGITDFYL